MNASFFRRGDLRLAYDVLGPASGQPVLLLAGNGCSSVYWPEAFCASLVVEGLRVIRLDARDTGASTHRSFDAHPYDLDDLALDALELLGHLGVARAHVVGLSMGGFIALRMALRAPHLVSSLTSLLSTPDYAVMLHSFCGGEPPTSDLPPPSAAWMQALARLPQDLTQAELGVESWRLANGARAPFDEAYWRALGEQAAARGDDAETGTVHRQASQRTPRKNLLGELPSLGLPALFISGSEDPIFHPRHAEAAAAAAHGRALCIDGLGHALNPCFFTPLAEAILAHVASTCR
jgi:pimeloyl-ACP methyl ester carboxylesterase